jgi:hypothetical protein
MDLAKTEKTAVALAGPDANNLTILEISVYIKKYYQ